jgi:hypothetical protein
MYIGSEMRYKVTANNQITYVGQSDPQYQCIFQECKAVKLIWKKRIYLPMVQRFW